MTIERWTHNWEPYRNGYEVIPGKPFCAVRIKPTPQGYLWVNGKQYGFSATLAEAKEWAETAREIWPKRLPA